MNLYPISFQEALQEIGPLEEWIKVIETVFLKKEIDFNKVKVIYHWGFFHEKVGDKDKGEFYNKLYTSYEYMEYEDRLQEELSKVRTNIVIEYKKFILSNRLEETPEDIKIIVGELTKIKMLAEGKEHGNQDTINSIPEIDKTIIGYEEITFDDEVEEVPAPRDIDEILDKIFESGIESLTDEERYYLKNQGK